MGRKRDKNFQILTVFWPKSHTPVPIEIKFGITVLKFNTIGQKSRLYAGQKPAKCRLNKLRACILRMAQPIPVR